jgi:hypothetical protein
LSETTIQHEDPHERTDVRLNGLLIFAAIMAAFLLLAAAALWLVFGVHQGGFAAARPLGQKLPGDELEQREQLVSYMQVQKAELQRLAWTDGTHQYAKVPIDDAMQLLAAKGDKR